MLPRRKFLLIAWLFVLFHTVKDFFQDFLESDFLWFLDANENLFVLPRWSRGVLVLSNEVATWIGIGLIFITPLVIKKHLSLIKKHLPLLEKLVIFAYLFFFAVLTADLLLDPRITHPKLFFDKSTRIPASEFKKIYSDILNF